MEEYLRNRKSLKRVMLVIDARHGLKPKDLNIMDMIER
jgi:GTP-binding protein